MLKGAQTSIPAIGKVAEHLKASDHIICDVTSLDLWIKFKLVIDSSDKSLESEFEMKIDKEMKGSELMNIV